MDIIYCGHSKTLQNEKSYTWNSLRFTKEKPLRIYKETEVSIEWKKEGGHLFPYVTTDKAGIPCNKEKQCTHILMSASQMDEKWSYPVLKKYISSEDHVCILAFSFFEDVKSIQDWNCLYRKGQGLEYREHTDVFFKYGIPETHITWVNYFNDSKNDIVNKIVNSSILFLPGGAPDLMMKRIKELHMQSYIKKYKGIMIGYSAGAMVQFKSYHITPDEVYPVFRYETGLGCLHGFTIECHYQGRNIQKKSIEKVIEEKAIPVYAIGEQGGICIQNHAIECFGDVTYFASEK